MPLRQKYLSSIKLHKQGQILYWFDMDLDLNQVQMGETSRSVIQAIYVRKMLFSLLFHFVRALKMWRHVSAWPAPKLGPQPFMTMATCPVATFACFVINILFLTLGHNNILLQEVHYRESNVDCLTCKDISLLSVIIILHSPH